MEVDQEISNFYMFLCLKRFPKKFLHFMKKCYENIKRMESLFETT